LSTNSSNKTLKNIEQIRNGNPSLHRTDEFSQSTKSSNKTPKKIEQVQNENRSLHRTDECSPSTKPSKKTQKNKTPNSDRWQLEEQSASPELNSSLLESHALQPKTANVTPKKTEQQTEISSNFDWWNLGEGSAPPEPQSTSLESHASCGRPEKIEEPKSANASWKRQSHSRYNAEPRQRKASSVSRRLVKDMRKELTLDETPSVASRSRSATSQSLFESENASMAQEAAESFKAEVNLYDPNIQIRKQCSTPKTPKEHILSSPVENETLKQTRRRKLLAKLEKDKKKAQLPTTPSLGTPSFDSSKSSSYAEEAVASLQAERRQNPNIHITRSFSMKQLAQEEKNDTPIEKPKRAGRRPVPSRSFSGKKKPPASSNSEPKSLVHELKAALSDRNPPVSAEQEQNHCPWFDSSQSDGTAPLASEVPLSLPATPPTSFKARRDAYLNKIGDCDEKRRQNPFTTANWVLGHLPEVPESSKSQGAAEREEEEETLVSWHEIGTQSPGRAKKWTTRESVEMNMEKDVENAGNVSPGRVIKKWMARENVRKNAAARKHDPLHESGKDDPHKPHWAQRSFINRFAPSSTPSKDYDETVMTPSGSRLVRSKSSNEKGNARRTSLGKLVRSSSKSSVDRERDEPSRQPVRSDSKLSDRSEMSHKPSLRRHLGRKYSGNRENDDSSRKQSSRRVPRNSSKSSRTPSLMSANKSSVDREEESLLDSGYESSDNNDTVSISRKKSSSWRVKTMTKTVKRPSSGRFGKQSVTGTSTPKKPSSSRFGRIVDKLSKDHDSYALLECKSSLDQESHCIDQQPPSSGRFGKSKPNKKRHEDITSRDPSSRRLKDTSDDKRDKPVSRRISSSSSSSRKNQEKHDSSSTLEGIDKRDDSTNSMKNSRTKQPSSRRVGTNRRDSGKSSRRRDQNGHKTSKTESTNSHRNEARKHNSSSNNNNDSSSSSSSEIDNINSKKHKDGNMDDGGAIPKHSRRTRFRKNTFQRLAHYKNYRTKGIMGSDTNLKRFNHLDMTGGME
jgi:hypothetical protein